MKLLKYIIFLSILISIFLTISREFKSKGLRGLWRSLKMSIVMAAALIGLIPIPENKEGSYRINSTQSQSVIIEQVVETPRGGFLPNLFSSSQEFNQKFVIKQAKRNLKEGLYDEK